MLPNNLKSLEGLSLSIVRFYGDTLGLHFGNIGPHLRKGTVGSYALHVSCPWRLDGPSTTITGSNDRWEYADPTEEPPEGWEPDSGPTLSDVKFDALFGARDKSGSRFVGADKYLVVAVRQTTYGDVEIEMSNGYRVLLFPAAVKVEAWRMFSPNGGSPHMIFPSEVSED